MDLFKASSHIVLLTTFIPIIRAEWSAEGRIGLRFYKNEAATFIEEPMEKGLKIFENEHFNKTLPIVILIHGMDASVNCEFVEGSVKAMFFREINKQFNIIAMNLPELMAKQNIDDKYLYTTALNSKIAGRAIGKFFSQVITHQYTTPDKIHMIGYSMGAQVAGYAARTIRDAHGHIKYIMSLDPAGIGFTPGTIAAWFTKLVHVSEADAKFTHTMNCNSVGWGSLYRNATANFIFNGGNLQPGCLADSNLACSHNRVPFYFIESILFPSGFLAQRCHSWKKFQACECTSEDTRYVTFPPDLQSTGDYYLRTYDQSPFGQGSIGTSCLEIIRNEVTSNEEKIDNSKKKRLTEFTQTKPLKSINDNMIMHSNAQKIKLTYHHRKKSDYMRAHLNKLEEREAIGKNTFQGKLEYQNRKMKYLNEKSLEQQPSQYNHIISHLQD